MGSILATAGLRFGNIDVIERLLEHKAALAALASNKQDKVSPDNPLPSLGYVYGLEAALSAAAASVVGIDGVTGLTEALAAKQSVIGPGSALECESLQCSLIRARTQSINLSASDGTVLLELSPSYSTFLRTVGAPSLDVSGSILCSGSALFAGPLYIGGTDILTLVATKQNLITPSTPLSCASLDCSVLRVASGQTNLYVPMGGNGVVLVDIGPESNTFLNRVSAPAMDSTGLK